MEARGIRLQGEHGISRQTIAQGMPECSSCTCMLVCVFFALIAHETAGAASTRHSLRPLLLGEMICKTSGAMRREIAETHSVVIVRGRSSIPEAAVIEPISRGVLDTRLRGYDGLHLLRLIGNCEFLSALILHDALLIPRP